MTAFSDTPSGTGAPGGGGSVPGQGTAALGGAAGGGARRFRHQVAVRWADCDAAGVVHYPNYFAFFEAAFAALLRERGLGLRATMRAAGVSLPRVEISCRFLGPASYDDEVAVELERRAVRPRIAILAFRVLRARDEALLATGEVRFCAVPSSASPGTDRHAIELPPALRGVLETLPEWTEPEEPGRQR